MLREFCEKETWHKIQLKTNQLGTTQALLKTKFENTKIIQFKFQSQTHDVRSSHPRMPLEINLLHIR